VFIASVHMFVFTWIVNLKMGVRLIAVPINICSKYLLAVFAHRDKTFSVTTFDNISIPEPCFDIVTHIANTLAPSRGGYYPETDGSRNT